MRRHGRLTILTLTLAGLSLLLGACSASVSTTDESSPGPKTYANGMRISIYKLAREVKPAEVPKLKKEISGVVKQLIASLPGAKIDQPLEELKVNGVPGFGFSYSYVQGDMTLKGVRFFLVNGQYEYVLMAEAASEDWETLKGKFESAFQTFTLK